MKVGLKCNTKNKNIYLNNKKLSLKDWHIGGTLWSLVGIKTVYFLKYSLNLLELYFLISYPSFSKVILKYIIVSPWN